MSKKLQKLSKVLLSVLAIGAVTITYGQDAFVGQSQERPDVHRSNFKKADKEEDGETQSNKEKRKSKNNYTSGFHIDGAVFTTLPYVADDNPSGYTQTRISANFNRYMPNPEMYNSHLFRNVYVDGLFSKNVDPINSFTDTSTKPLISSINRIDLIQHANSMINIHENLFYYHNNKYKSTWKTYFYIDLMESYLRTNVKDSLAKNTYNVDTWLLGCNASFYAVNWNSNGKVGIPMSIKLSSEIFWINPLTNSLNTDLGFQYANRGDFNNPINKNRNFNSSPGPNFHFNVLANFQISKQKPAANASNSTGAGSGDNIAKNVANVNSVRSGSDSNSGAQHYLFIHLGYYSNLGVTDSKYYNSFFQAQIGVSFDVLKLIQDYKQPTN